MSRRAPQLLGARPAQKPTTIIIRPAYLAPVSCVLLVQQFGRVLLGWGSSGKGFIIEYYLIVINIASVKRKIIKPKYPVACSRSVGAAGERVLLIMEYAFVCGGSAGELCLSCAAPIVIETRVMNKTCDPVSIRVRGFDPEFRVPGLVFAV